jgi:hypothetical protein
VSRDFMMELITDDCRSIQIHTPAVVLLSWLSSWSSYWSSCWLHDQNAPSYP